MLSARALLQNLFCALMLGLAACTVLNAQTAFSTLRGTVSDATGASVQNAVVTLNEAATGIEVRHQTADAQGNYEFPDLKPGTYRLKCSMQGFQAFQADGIVLDSGQVRRLDVSLAVGESAQTVTVKEGASVINTETGSIGGELKMKQIEEAPLIDTYPSPSLLLTTMPGVQGGTGGLGGIRMNGLTYNQQSESFDGIVNDLSGGQTNNIGFFSAISATTVNAPAESSRPGYHNLTSKSGSNEFHGMGYYKIFSSGLMARNFFAPVRTPYLQHVWQLEGGGPIIRNRTFIYGTWFSERIPLGSFARATVPTAAMRSGDFSGITASIKDPVTGQAFGNNQIPASRISPVSQRLQDLFYPAPTVNAASKYYSVNNYGFQFPYASDLFRGDWPLLRLDHYISSKNSIFGRWLMRRTPYILQNGLPTEVWTRWRDEQQWAVVDTHVFSPSLVNVIRLGMARDYITDGKTINGFTPADGSKVLSEIGLLGSNPGNTTGQGLPTMSISGLTTI